MRTIVINSYKPKVRDYFNKIVIDNDNKVQYIFDSDGVWTAYVSKDYVDERIARLEKEMGGVTQDGQ